MKPEALRPVGRTTLEQTPRDGVRILRDSWGVAHIYGRASADTEWAAGWVTAEDRGLVLQLIRGPGRVAAIDGPAYDQSREFVPSRAASSRIELRWTNRPSFQQVISFSGHRSR